MATHETCDGCGAEVGKHSTSSFEISFPMKVRRRFHWLGWADSITTEHYCRECLIDFHRWREHSLSEAT